MSAKVISTHDGYIASCSLCAYRSTTKRRRSDAAAAARQHDGVSRHQRNVRLAAVAAARENRDERGRAAA